MIIKQTPEDFYVREILTLDTKTGKYLYFILKKRDLTTIEAIKRLAIALKANIKNFNYAGLKDRVAITEQYVSWKNGSKTKLESLTLDGMSFEVIGFGDKPIYLGQNEGNFFRIVVRDVDTLPDIKPKFVNLYGEQRLKEGNAEIGKALIKRDFKRAAELLQKQAHIEMKGTDYVGAIRSMPKKLLILMVHSYQSYLWNKVALEWAKTDENISIPIVGFGTEDIDEITKAVLIEEGISPRDFIVREMPDISSEGDKRNLYATAKDLKIEKKENSVILEFSLPKGSYATEFVRQSFEPTFS
jgi:tRNA pseudouridine13 synthase